MRITYIHQHYPRLPSEGGLNRPWQFARRLANDGHHVTLIAGSDTSRRTVVDGVRIIHVRAPYANEFGTLKRIGVFLLFLARATFLSLRTRADVVLASSTPLTVAVPGMIGALLNRARFVFEVRDLWPTIPIEMGILTNPVLKSLAKGLERVTYRRADAVIALSDGMAQGVRKVNSRVPIVVVPNASDFDLFPPDAAGREEVRAAYGWKPTETVIVYAGSFGRIYNLNWVIDLAAELEPTGVRIVLFGTGGTLPTLKQRANALGLDTTSLFPGRLRKQDLARVIAVSDATISSVLVEPCLEPASINKVFESMAAAKGIFFNHDGWLTDLVTAHGGGWRLNDDPAAAATEVQAITADRHQLRAAGARNAELGRDRFHRDKLYIDFRTAVLGEYDAADPGVR